jgi:hypothetical protein
MNADYLTGKKIAKEDTLSSEKGHFENIFAKAQRRGMLCVTK